MRETTQDWKEIVAKGEFNMESVARIYGATGNDTNGVSGSDTRGSYKEYATITAPVITRALLSGDSISVGNAISGQLNFTVMTTDTIPKSAMIVILARVKNDSENDQILSEWLEFGTYWIDHRIQNDDLIDIEAYDAMKKGNQAYSDNSQALSWPKTVKVVVQRIAQQMGVSIDSRTVTDIINSDIGNMEIIVKPKDDEVLLDILQHIGEAFGGNWTITDDNELRFVRLVDSPKETYFIVDEAHNFIKSEQDDYLIYQGDQQQHVEQVHPYGGGTCFVPVVIGSLTTASKYTISKVTIALDSEHVFSRGDNTGFELIASENNPYASAAVADKLYSRVNGIEYSPFEITNAIYDPATELGDWIVAGSVYSVLYNDKRTLGIGFSADISAPGRDELEDEYPYQSALRRTEYRLEATERELGHVESELRSEIRQTQDSIMATVEETYAHSNVFNTTLASDVIYYLAYDSNTGVTTETTGWQTTLPVLTQEKSYLWVYRDLTYGNGETRRIAPSILHDYYFGGVCTEVKRLYYASNSGTSPDKPTTTINNTSTSPLRWTKSIPVLSEEYPYLYLCYEISADDSDTRWTDVERDTVTTLTVSGFMRSATLELTQHGAEITAIERDYTRNDEIRSTFALDPSNITLTAGEDTQHNPTGQITFNAGALIVNSNNFTLSADGKMECTGAVIRSESQSGLDNYAVNIGNGSIFSGSISSPGAKISFSDVWGQTSNALYIQAPEIDYEVGTVCVIDTSDWTLYTAFNGTMRVVTGVNAGGGYSYTDYKVINGLIMQ